MELTTILDALSRKLTPLIRADHTDDAAWSRILREIQTPVDVTASGDPDEFMAPDVVAVDEADAVGVTGETLAAALAEIADPTPGYALIADGVSMREAQGDVGEVTLVYVDLSCTDPEDADAFGTFLGRSFRCVIAEVAAIDANLSISNMDFSEFADHADEHGGVFSGFGSDD